MNFKEAKKALSEGKPEIVVHGFNKLSDQEKEEFYTLLAQKAKYLTTVELYDHIKCYIPSDQVAQRLEKIFIDAKNFSTVMPRTDKLFSVGMSNWTAGLKYCQILITNCNEKLSYTKHECEEIRDHLPQIKKQYLKELEHVQHIGWIFREQVLPYAARIAKTHGIYLMEFLEPDWTPHSPQEKELAEWHERLKAKQADKPTVKAADMVEQQP